MMNSSSSSRGTTGWKGALGVVDTIYEEEEEVDYDEHDTITSDSISSSVSSDATPPHSWSSLAPAGETNVAIYVQGTSFHLHKEHLISRSTYLERELQKVASIRLPFKITVETFNLVRDFCYGLEIAITPYNVAALITAAEQLGMTSTINGHGDNLKQVTKNYFQRVIADNRELALITFCSCMRLLPEAETTARLVSRCIRALKLTEEEGDEVMNGFLDAIINLGAEEFLLVAGCMQRAMSSSSHDLLYRVADIYIREHSAELNEEQKMYICNCIDCNKLSPQHLMDAVLNSRMPVRFNIGALLIEHLNTRRAVSTTSNTNHKSWQQDDSSHSTAENTTTLGSIFQSEAMRRESAQMKAQMNDADLRILTLERKLASMKIKLAKSKEERDLLMEKKLLNEPVNEIFYQDMEEFGDERSIMGSSRSSSFHYGYREGRIEKGERGSASFASFRPGLRGERAGMMRSSSIYRNHPLSSCYDEIPAGKNNKKKKSKGFLSRLIGTFWSPKSATKGRSPS